MDINVIKRHVLKAINNQIESKGYLVNTDDKYEVYQIAKRVESPLTHEPIYVIQNIEYDRSMLYSLEEVLDYIKENILNESRTTQPSH